jgi:hypothetical protein
LEEEERGAQGLEEGGYDRSFKEKQEKEELVVRGGKEGCNTHVMGWTKVFPEITLRKLLSRRHRNAETHTNTHTHTINTHTYNKHKLTLAFDLDTLLLIPNLPVAEPRCMQDSGGDVSRSALIVNKLLSPSVSLSFPLPSRSCSSPSRAHAFSLSLSLSLALEPSQKKQN